MSDVYRDPVAALRRQPAHEAPQPIIPRHLVDLLSAPASPAAVEALQAWLRRFVRSCDAEADVTRAGPRDLLARFTADGAPIALALRHHQQPVHHVPVSTHYRVALTTSVALAAPRLRLRPELWRHTLVLKPLRLVRDISIDDLTFDGMFIIETDDVAGARRLLAEPVRAALMRIAHVDVPTVTVEDGGAQISWSYEPEEPFGVSDGATAEETLRTAVRALVLLRRAPAPSHLDPDPPAGG